MELKLSFGFMRRLFHLLLNKSFFMAFAFLLFSGNKAFSKNDNPNFPTVNTPGSDNNNPNAHPPHASAPFDAGLTLLIAAGIGYGVKRSYDKRKGMIKRGHDEPIY